MIFNIVETGLGIIVLVTKWPKWRRVYFYLWLIMDVFTAVFVLYFAANFDDVVDNACVQDDYIEGRGRS